YVLRQKVKIGAIIVVQTHGRSGKYNPHLHIIMTSGGIDEETGCFHRGLRLMCLVPVGHLYANLMKQKLCDPELL
ncbi:MAG: hypothetical protein D3916_16845, partial [Candidatus Electrothrix sp. MAN1_4]|nr:hypothetical protein [Candidatus Electrothrix sp. MAN1_4]